MEESETSRNQNKHEQDNDQMTDVGNKTTMVSLSHECRLKEIYLKHAAQEVCKLEKELEKLRLERKWCFDAKGDRLVPSPEDQAKVLCEQILNDDEMTKDVVRALRMKKLDLQINVKNLKQMCDALGEKLK